MRFVVESGNELALASCAAPRCEFYAVTNEHRLQTYFPAFIIVYIREAGSWFCTDAMVSKFSELLRKYKYPVVSIHLYVL